MKARKNLAMRMRLLERRMDYQAGLFDRSTRKKLTRMLSNPRSCFYFTNPRSPLFIGKE